MNWGTSATSNMSPGCRRSRFSIQPSRVGRWNDTSRVERSGWCVLTSSPTSGRPSKGKRSRSKPGCPRSNNVAPCASIWFCERMTRACWSRPKPTGSTLIGKVGGHCEFRMNCELLLTLAQCRIARNSPTMGKGSDANRNHFFNWQHPQDPAVREPCVASAATGCRTITKCGGEEAQQRLGVVRGRGWEHRQEALARG
jgi:hypothetical protein